MSGAQRVTPAVGGGSGAAHIDFIPGQTSNGTVVIQPGIRGYGNVAPALQGSYPGGTVFPQDAGGGRDDNEGEEHTGIPVRRARKRFGGGGGGAGGAGTFPLVETSPSVSIYFVDSDSGDDSDGDPLSITLDPLSADGNAAGVVYLCFLQEHYGDTSALPPLPTLSGWDEVSSQTMTIIDRDSAPIDDHARLTVWSHSVTVGLGSIAVVVTGWTDGQPAYFTWAAYVVTGVTSTTFLEEASSGAPPTIASLVFSPLTGTVALIFVTPNFYNNHVTVGIPVDVTANFAPATLDSFIQAPNYQSIADGETRGMAGVLVYTVTPAADATIATQAVTLTFAGVPPTPITAAGIAIMAS